MKNMKIKTILTLAALALLLTFTVSGTLAYLVTNTGEVENVFTPVEIETRIGEEFDKTVKSSVTVTNGADSIPVYVRVAVVGNWVDDEGNIVEPWTSDFTVGDGWDDGDDGYYYYTTPVQPGSSTSDLLKSNIETEANDGLHLEVVVMQQSVQAEPTTAVTELWGVTVDANGTISK